MRTLLAVLFLFFSSSIHAELKVLAFAGSTREKSFNKQLIQEASAILKQKGAHVTVIDLKDYPMPFYDADIEEKEGQPKTAKDFRKLMMESDIIVIATPEYNGSISGILKNVIDWATRDEGKPSLTAFQGKKFILMSASPGKGGGSQALEHLRTIVTRLGGNVLPDTLSIPLAHEVLSQNESNYQKELLKILTMAESKTI